MGGNNLVHAVFISMNILLISTIYPLLEGNKGTPVCHYFAREWVKMDYNVRVVHYQAVFPMPFYWAARLNRQKIAAKTGAVVYTKRDRGERYEMDGVSVYRIPLFKFIPHGKYTKRTINKSIKKIIDWFDADGFSPDIIIGHFPNPQIEIVGQLKEIWPQAKSAIVMHGDIGLAKKVYGDRLSELCKKIDVWGFRNESVRKSFNRLVMTVDHSFICYSGIPEQYITQENRHDFNRPLHSFVYVGEMIERKYPLRVIDALEKAYPDSNYKLTYVGNGKLLDEINGRIERDGLADRVTALGKIPRDSIKEQYDKADCMVMISKSEAYGLVYLEAMARGCITIASRNEGFDGVIRDGENGFLCKAGDADELASIIQRINALTPKERQQISDNAIATAQSLTDYKAAKRYIEDLING